MACRDRARRGGSRVRYSSIRPRSVKLRARSGPPNSLESPPNELSLQPAYHRLDIILDKCGVGADGSEHDHKRRGAIIRPCPLCPRKRPNSGHRWTSQKCHSQTLAPGHSTTSSARCEPPCGHAMICQAAPDLNERDTIPTVRLAPARPPRNRLFCHRTVFVLVVVAGALDLPARPRIERADGTNTDVLCRTSPSRRPSLPANGGGLASLEVTRARDCQLGPDGRAGRTDSTGLMRSSARSPACRRCLAIGCRTCRRR